MRSENTSFSCRYACACARERKSKRVSLSVCGEIVFFLCFSCWLFGFGLHQYESRSRVLKKIGESCCCCQIVFSSCFLMLLLCMHEPNTKLNANIVKRNGEHREMKIGKSRTKHTHREYYHFGDFEAFEFFKHKHSIFSVTAFFLIVAGNVCVSARACVFLYLCDGGGAGGP